GGGDILKTCLQVLSSAYRPEACPIGQVKAMALILPQCIHCRLGGVVFSHSTLDDDTMQVDYTLGQPRAGQSGTQPHRYTIRRWGGEDSELDYQFTPGDIATQLALVKVTHEEGYLEQATAATTDTKEHLLADATLKKLLQYAQNLEDIVCCPVYFTFGVGDGPAPYLFQFRPVTRSQGSTHSPAESTALPLAEGIMVSEGCPSSLSRVAGSFADRPGAWLLTEDQSNSTTADPDSISSPTNGPAESPDFTRVDEGFGWINQQTARLLDYFHADRLISRCLGPGQSKAVSMSPNRSMLLLQLALEILSLKESLHQFVSGYRRFLDLATGCKAGARPSEVQSFINELPFLKEQWRCLEDAINDLYPKVVTPLITDQELPEQPPKFRHWLRDCQALGDALQKLNQPGKVCDIHSARDLIYWLHQRFISALPPVAEASDQGEITKIAKKVRDRTQIDLLPQGVSGLLNDNYKSILAKVNAQMLCMLNMVAAANIKVALGTLVYTITMMEQAEGVKNRTLTLHIADDFSRDNIDLQGRLKRFWFLVQTLRCASIEIDSQPMAISFNQCEGTMTIEYTRVNSTLALKAGFVTLMYILSGMECMDVSINKSQPEKIHTIKDIFCQNPKILFPRQFPGAVHSLTFHTAFYYLTNVL
uniref:PEP/pyruvate-binding domain-containing protein n=1 Tax=Endozoicomonas sp. ONNA2 TaxID=2828741 RepID=UPI00214964DF